MAVGPQKPILRQQGGHHIWTAEAPDWSQEKESRIIGVPKEAINLKLGRGQTVATTQLFGNIGMTLHETQHVFKGLRRGMMVDGDNGADSKKLTLTWRPSVSFWGHGSAHKFEMTPVPPPENCVFAVYVTENTKLTEFPDIDGWAEHWTWLPEDEMLSGAPLYWENRYDSKIWSKEGK